MEQAKREKKKLFRNPFASKKCDECGSSYQAVKSACPHCGKENQTYDRSFPFDETRMMDPFSELAIFLIGWLGLQLIAIIVSDIISLTIPNSEYGTMILNYVSYTVIFLIILAISARYLPKLFKNFFRKETLFGFLVLLAIIIFDVEWSRFASLFETSENINQSTVTSLIDQSPALAMLFTGLIAPFCEEMTYRAGFFTFAKRCNRVLAYVLVSVLFGFIHMHDLTSLNEWLNLPPYIFSGLAFSFAYEKFGLGASLVAHVSNNVMAVFLEVLL